jgi:hypothetical protein
MKACRPAYWTPERLAAAWDEFASGESIPRIALRHGMSPSSLNVALKRSGRDVSRRPTYWTPERLAQARIWLDEGHTQAEVAHALGGSKSGLAAALGKQARAEGTRSGGTWTVDGPHEHVIAQGVCLLCDRAVASA